MKYEMKIERSSSDKVTVEFAKYHSTGASEFRSVDLYDDEVEMLKEEFCGQLEKKNAELKKRNGELAGQKASLERWFGEAKEILTKILNRLPSFQAKSFEDLYLMNALSQAEQFLSEVKE